MAKKSNNTAQKVFNIAKPIVEQNGLMLWDTRFEKEGANWILRIIIDSKDESGITLENCETISRALDPILDEEDPIDQSYFLEVSSPGIERELVRKEHFESSLGKGIIVRLIRPLNDTKEFVGILSQFDDDSITISCEDADYRFEYDDCAYIKTQDNG